MEEGLLETHFPGTQIGTLSRPCQGTMPGTVQPAELSGRHSPCWGLNAEAPCTFPSVPATSAWPTKGSGPGIISAVYISIHTHTAQPRLTSHVSSAASCTAKEVQPHGRLRRPRTVNPTVACRLSHNTDVALAPLSPPPSRVPGPCCPRHPCRNALDWGLCKPTPPSSLSLEPPHASPRERYA